MKPEYEEMVQRLKQNDEGLTVLNLRQKNLTSEESQEFFNALIDNTRVRKVQFLGNNSSGVAAIALSAMLKKNHTIDELELGSNKLNNDDIIHVVNGLRENSTVTILDLNSNLFDAAAPIAELLEHNNHIHEIELTNSAISNEGFVDIYKGLEKNHESSLTAFNVYFPFLPCIDDFNDLCSANASRLSARPF